MNWNAIGAVGDIEDLLAERGITVSREAIRLWYPKQSLRSWGTLWIKFGAKYARRLKRKHRGYGDTFYVDEVFLQSRRDAAAAKRFF